MSQAEVDGALVQWGERLFYPRNRSLRSSTPRLNGGLSQRAAEIRLRIAATVVRRAPQVMVKVTGGGRGMQAISAHFRYISKAGRLPFEDDRGVMREGREALSDLAEQWRLGGSYIDETTLRREAFNIMLSMPRGTDALAVQRSAREFAQAELTDHRYVMVLHDHQANPHVHISVRAESQQGRRLNPRKADLQRWREMFAEKLRGWGIDAEASRQRTRGQIKSYDSLWRLKAVGAGRLKTPGRVVKSGPGIDRDHAIAAEAWRGIVEGLCASESAADRLLSLQIARFLADSPVVRSKSASRERTPDPSARGVQQSLPGLEIPR